LEERLTAAVERVASVATDTPTVGFVGLRYINRVEIAEPSVDFEDYLTITLTYPPGYPSLVTGFLDRVELEYPGEETRLAFTWASTEAPENSMAFILDLDLTARCPDAIPIDQAFDLLRELKTKEGRAFEALLQDKLREQFGEIPEQ
jgi:uncharacterized protein (TIGR04255 family)